MDDVPSIERESIDDQTIDIHDSNVKLTDEQRLPANITNLSLDSATIKIRSLEDEIRKIDIDRQHWHSLAKQVSLMFFLSYFLLLLLFTINVLDPIFLRMAIYWSCL